MSCKKIAAIVLVLWISILMGGASLGRTGDRLCKTGALAVATCRDNQGC